MPAHCWSVSYVFLFVASADVPVKPWDNVSLLASAQWPSSSFLTR